MREDRIRANQLGLRVGDWLTFHDGRVRVRVVEIQEYILKAIPETAELQDLSKPYSESLRNITFRLTGEAYSLNECLDLWHINKKVLRRHYMEQQDHRSNLDGLERESLAKRQGLPHGSIGVK